MSSKQTNWPYVINLGNSIIGVSVLAMPFCFKECGVLLGMLLLLGSAWLTQASCGLLIKGAVTSRKRSYEFLALHTFGVAGKLAVEVSIIGLLIGTMIAFFVIIGDLGPGIVSKMIGIENTWNLRTFLMLFLAVFVATPLGLLRNVESLSNISAISIGFYSVFIADIFALAFPHLWSGLWVTKVSFWNPEGVFKCLPIFSLAFACQSQMFVMYDALMDPSIKRMTGITKSAIGMCTTVYLMVGYFGYVAFCDEDVAGDILMNFRPTIFSEALKLGFVLSVAVSFPLAIFPCRAAIYTLVFAKDLDEAKGQHDSLMGPIYIPDIHFKLITFSIIMATLCVGILVPNIEFVLAITGATMGSMICYIFPAVMFISIMSMAKGGGGGSNKSMAQVVLFLGVTILLASTYVTLNVQDQNKTAVTPRAAEPDLELDQLPIDNPAVFKPPKYASKRQTVVLPPDGSDVIKEDKEVKKESDGKAEGKELEEDEVRQEPPIPHEPSDTHREGEDQEAEKKDEEKKDLNDEEKKKEEEEKKKKEEEEKEKNEDKAEVKELLSELKKQQAANEKMIAEQKQIIEQLKQHQEEHKIEAEQKQKQQQQVNEQQQQQPVIQQDSQQQQQQQPAVQQANQQELHQQPIAPLENQQQQQQQPVVQLQQQPVVSHQQKSQQLAEPQQANPLLGQAAPAQQQPVTGQNQQAQAAGALEQAQQFQENIEHVADKIDNNQKAVASVQEAIEKDVGKQNSNIVGNQHSKQVVKPVAAAINQIDQAAGSRKQRDIPSAEEHNVKEDNNIKDQEGKGRVDSVKQNDPVVKVDQKVDSEQKVQSKEAGAQADDVDIKPALVLDGQNMERNKYMLRPEDNVTDKVVAAPAEVRDRDFKKRRR